MVRGPGVFSLAVVEAALSRAAVGVDLMSQGKKNIRACLAEPWLGLDPTMAEGPCLPWPVVPLVPPLFIVNRDVEGSGLV
jgi:hypothetical protein